MKKLRAAIIGLGKQSIEDHLPGILGSKYTDLVAVCDVDKKKVSMLASKYHVLGYDNYKNLLKTEKLDFVIVAVPHSEYVNIINEAAKHKVHILKEKPFARNLKEAILIKEIVEKNKIHFMITLQRRFNPIYTTFFQLKEKVGRKLFLDAKQTMFLKNPQNGWRANKKIAGGGVVLDLGYHLIDLIIWYFGLPDNVFCEFTIHTILDKDHSVEDTATILFKYNDGFHGSLTISSYYSPKTQDLKLIGTKGRVEVERGAIRKFNETGEMTESLIRENSWPSAATDQIDYFCKVIKGDKTNLGNHIYHLQHAAFIDACYKSKKFGKYIDPKKLLAKHLNKI